MALFEDRSTGSLFPGRLARRAVDIAGPATAVFAFAFLFALTLGFL